ncbi:pseudouridine synthase [Microcella indica]|uniref:pseudouridine synthase n=1 Tax=Microcella indica TaxID=2750620 RepID=UPI0015CF3250|nr:pseudouridine synthase [Microcella indica]
MSAESTGAESTGADATTPDAPAGERLQKVMAAAGVASRRVCEDYIAQGRVTVNGEPVVEPGRRVDPATDEVALDGVAIQLDTTKRYVMLNKPTGVVSTMKDESGRPDLRRYTDRFEERLYNVGRLDAETSGLLLLTNDGELANVLAHPRFGVEKTYIAKVRGSVTAPVLRKLKEGIELDDGPIAADAARMLGNPVGGYSMVELTLHSGRNRIVRRMLAAVDHPVVELVRRSFGPLHLGTLAAGEVRDLTKVERGALLTLSRAARGGSDATDAAAAEARATVDHPDTLDTNPGAPR